ncbi:argininosuccinate lyase (plasmid) [Sinorhizobium meliloti]
MKQQDSRQYRGYRNAGIRLREELVPSLALQKERTEPYLYAFHMFDKAHMVMLAEEDLIPKVAVRQLLGRLRDMEKDDITKARLEIGGGMHSGEQYLIRSLGENIGGLFHLGRSSGDLWEVGFRIFARDNLLRLLTDIFQMRGTLITLAAEHADTVMPGYSHGQHAQPTTWAHMLLSWASALERDCERLLLAFRHTNRSPAGAAILTGSDFPLNRQRVAALLGFEQVEKNTFDAIMSHDLKMEMTSVLTVLYLNLARFADDLMLYCTAEYNYIEFPDRFCGTSSIMMQKKNPYAPQYIKGAAAETAGGLVTSILVEKDPTSFPIMDRDSTYKSIERSFATLARDLGWMNEFMPALKIHKERMQEQAGAHWAQATDVAGALVREHGLAWRTAHQIIGIVVRLSEDRNIQPSDVTPDLIDEASIEYMGRPVGLSATSLKQALDPAGVVNRRTSFGGPAPAETKMRIEDYRALLERDEQEVQRLRSHLAVGASTLERAIDELLNSE